MSMEELQDHIKIKEEEIKDIQKGNAAASINHECQNKSLKEKEKSLELVARQICEMNENIKQTKAKQAVEVQILQDRLKFLLFHNKISKDEREIEYDDRMADEEEHKDNRMKCLLQEKETLKHLIENDRKEHHRLLQERNVYYQQQKQEKEQQLQKNLDDAKDECKERIFRTQNEIQIQIHNNENEMTEKMNSFLRESKDKQREVMNKTMKYYNEILAENIRIIDVLKEQIKHKQMTLDEKRRENQNLRIENEKLITPIETINEEVRSGTRTKSSRKITLTYFT